MPTIRKDQGAPYYHKRVEFVAKDEVEQIATGIVMVPDKADLQNDFVRPDTLGGFAEQFADLYAVEQADGGVMHAAFPSEWLDLERNEILEADTEINGRSVGAGAWRQDWRFHDDDLWQLVEDEILEGLSIGAIDVRWNGPFEQDELDDVDTSEVPDGELVWELISGLIREVSFVDIPAVPDAQVLETKDAYRKRLADHLGDQGAFIEEALDRGHTEAEAERLWDVLTSAIEVDGAGRPGKASFFERIGRGVIDVMRGADEPPEADTRERRKEGRELNAANRADLKAVMDAADTVLESAGVDTAFTRFTDREDDAFDLSDHDARPIESITDEPDDEEDETAPMNRGAGADNPDGADNMTDEEDNPGEEAKALAEANAEQIEDLTAAVQSLTESIRGEEAVELEIDGTVYEVTRSEVERWFSEDDDSGDDNPIADLRSELASVTDRLDRMNQQAGISDQIGASTETEEDPDDGLKGLAEALN